MKFFFLFGTNNPELVVITFIVSGRKSIILAVKIVIFTDMHTNSDSVDLHIYMYLVHDLYTYITIYMYVEI